MNKIYILNICIFVNLLFLCIFIASSFIFNNGESAYFRVGWSDNFVFISMYINTPLKYFTLCGFIVTLNISEIFLDNVASPIIMFSTYNPYHVTVKDFTRNELEMYSNVLYFIQNSKRLLLIATVVSQIDLACLSLISCQASSYFAIKYLLDNKNFEKNNQYVEIPSSSWHNELSPLARNIIQNNYNGNNDVSIDESLKDIENNTDSLDKNTSNREQINI